MNTVREVMEYDVVVVGAGPSGLSAAIRLKQLTNEGGREISVCVIEKGSEVGAHLLSGAVLETRALDELIPDWRDRDAPIKIEATEDLFLFLTETKSHKLPTPPAMHNKGNYVVSIGEVARWMAAQAEALGVEIYPGFAAAEVLFHEDGSVKGVATGDMGIGKDGARPAGYTPGRELHARQTLLAEGCRGSLTKDLFERFDLGRDCDPQNLQHRHQGTVGDRSVQAQAWPDRTHDRLANGPRDLRRIVDVPRGRQPGLDRLRDRARLPESLSFPLRRIPAFQDTSGDPEAPGGRPASQLRCQGAVGRRVPVDPPAYLPRGLYCRRRRRLPQRAQDQGQPYRHEERHGLRRGGIRAPRL